MLKSSHIHPIHQVYKRYLNADYIKGSVCDPDINGRIAQTLKIRRELAVTHTMTDISFNS